MGVSVACVVVGEARLPEMGMAAEGGVLSAVHGPYQIAIVLQEGQFLGDPESRGQLVVTVRSEVPPLQRVQALTGLLASGVAVPRRPF